MPSRSNNMRVLHVMPSMDPTFGGPVTAIYAIARGLLEAGVSVDIVTVHSRSFSKDTCSESKDGVHWRSFPIQLPGYGISLPLKRWLQTHLHLYDLVHIHGVFSYASYMAARIARRDGVPYVVRPFGALNRWGMDRRKPMLKHFIFKWLEKPALDNTQAMHFTSDEEALDVARLKIKAPSVVIPLGLDLSPYQHLPPASRFEAMFPDFRTEKTILFLSRIDEKKGLDILLPAFKAVQSKISGVKLIIAGDGDRHLMDKLKRKAKRLAVEDSILWTGFLSGDTCLMVLAKATIFCLPSHSENFGMALLEAMAAGLPCVATDQVALSVEAAKAGAVYMTTLTVDSLADALIALLTDEMLRKDMSIKAREYAVRHHSMVTTAERLKRFYENLCISAPKDDNHVPEAAPRCI